MSDLSDLSSKLQVTTSIKEWDNLLTHAQAKLRQAYKTKKGVNEANIDVLGISICLIWDKIKLKNIEIGDVQNSNDEIKLKELDKLEKELDKLETELNKLRELLLNTQLQRNIRKRDKDSNDQDSDRKKKRKRVENNSDEDSGIDHSLMSEFIETVLSPDRKVNIYQRPFPVVPLQPCRYKKQEKAIPYQIVDGLFLVIDPSLGLTFSNNSRYLYIPPVYERLYLTIMDRLGYDVEDSTIIKKKNRFSEYPLNSWLVGSSGTGKSQFIFYMVYRLLLSGWDVSVYGFGSQGNIRDPPSNLSESNINPPDSDKRIKIFDSCYNSNIGPHKSLTVTSDTSKISDSFFKEYLSMPMHSHITVAGVASCFRQDDTTKISGSISPFVAYLSHIVHPGHLRLLSFLQVSETTFSDKFDQVFEPPLLDKIEQSSLKKISKLYNTNQYLQIPFVAPGFPLAHSILQSSYLYRNEPYDSERMGGELLVNEASDDKPSLITTNCNGPNNTEKKVYFLGRYCTGNQFTTFTPSHIEAIHECKCILPKPDTDTTEDDQYNQQLAFFAHLPFSMCNETLQKIHQVVDNILNEKSSNQNNSSIRNTYQSFFLSKHSNKFYMFSPSNTDELFPSQYDVIFSTVNGDKLNSSLNVTRSQTSQILMVRDRMKNRNCDLLKDLLFLSGYGFYFQTYFLYRHVFQSHTFTLINHRSNQSTKLNIGQVLQENVISNSFKPKVAILSVPVHFNNPLYDAVTIKRTKTTITIQLIQVTCQQRHTITSKATGIINTLVNKFADGKVNVEVEFLWVVNRDDCIFPDYIVRNRTIPQYKLKINQLEFF